MSKQPKSTVNYSRGHTGSRCGICMYYITGGTCKKVQGRIVPSMWCELFKK